MDKIREVELVTPVKAKDGIDKTVRKLTGKKWSYVGIHDYEHKCKVCGIEFHTEKERGETCQRWKCCKEFYMKM